MTSRAIEQLEEAFRRDPNAPEPFAALRRAYQAEPDGEKLASLFERRAAHMHDGRKAADLLWQAAEVHARRKDQEAEARVLRKAIEVTRGNLRALERLRAICYERVQWLEVIHLLEVELEVAREAKDNKRLALLEYEAGSVWEKAYGRFDRAIAHYQRAFKSDPSHTEAVAAGRRIYAGLGRWQTVASLYQVELDTCTDSKRRAELLLELGELFWERLGDLEAAARAYTEASKAKASDESILESLGELYASPQWPKPGGVEKAAGIFLQIAQRRSGRGDRDGAITYLRRALAVHPTSEPAFNRLEKIYEETGRFQELNELYRDRLTVVPRAEAIPLLRRRAELLDRRLGDRSGARECYQALAADEPPGGPAALRLLELDRLDGDWEKVAVALRRILDTTAEPAARVRLLFELAAIQRDHLADPEGGAHLLYQILDEDPGNRKALAAYEDYYRQKSDYRNLAELLRFAAQTGRETGAPPMEICARLEELADVSERWLGDLMGAVEAWQQIAEIHPDPQRSQEALSRLAAKIHTWQGMVQLLDRELASAANSGQRLQALRRAAQLYFEKKAEPLRCIELLREILTMVPTDEAALRMLVELYERQADHVGLAWALSAQLGGILTKAERMAGLRRLAEIYADKLDRPRDALAAYNALLELTPSDPATQEKIQALLEKTDDLEQLARLLERRAQAARGVSDRISALQALAELMEERLENPGRAAAYWEEVRSLEPNNKDALEALTRLYDRTSRHAELLEVLRRRLDTELDAAPLSLRTSLLRQLATVAEQRLGRHADALPAQEKLAELLPDDAETLDALARLYARLERHSDLTRVLGRQIELCDDDEQAVALAFKQGDLLEEKLGDLHGAVLIFDHIIQDLAPSDLDAHRRLKHLCIRLGDHARACQVAERELFLTESPQDRLALALEVARLWRDSGKDDQRAAACYERVLELDSNNVEALTELRRLYIKIGAVGQLQKLTPALFNVLPDGRERQQLVIELGQLNEERLRDPEGAFNWYRRAYDLYPDDEVAISHLRRLAEANGLWEDLLSALGEASKRAATLDDTQEFLREMSAICELRLHDPARAFQALLPGLPAGEQVVKELERLAELAGAHSQLLDVYDQVVTGCHDPERREEILRRRAAVAEGPARDAAAALESWIWLHALRPEDDQVLSEIERLAMVAGRWEDALQVHAERYASASRQQQLAILAHVAELIEHQMGDLGRAFRVHLRALSLAPDEPESSFHLWRLAGVLQSAAAAHPTSTSTKPPPPSTAPAPHERTESGCFEVSESMEVEIIDDERLQPRRPEARSGRLQFSPFVPVHTPPPPPPAGESSPFGRGQPIVAPWEELANAYRDLPTDDPASKLRHLLSAADVWARGAGEVERAFEMLAEAAQIDVEHPELERFLAELSEAHKRFDLRLAIYLDAIDRAAEAGSLIRLHLHVADLLSELGQLEQAEQHLSSVLTIQPQNTVAAELLGKLYTQLERWQDLADLKERQLEVLGASLPTEERAARLSELADLYQHTLLRPFETVDFLTKLAAEVPNDLSLQGRLADLYDELSIWPRLIEVLAGMLEQTTDPLERAGLLLRMGHTFEEELELPDRAIEAYQAVLLEEPTNADALQALDHLYEAHQRQDDLVQVLRLRVELSGSMPTEKRRLLRRLAEALEAQEEEGSLEEAVRCLERAGKLGPLEVELEEALARDLVKLGKPDVAVQRLNDLVSLCRQENRAPELIAGLLVRLARIHAGPLAEPDAAIAALDAALQLQPEGREVLEARTQLFEQTERWHDLVTTLSLLAETATATPDAVSAFLRAAGLAKDKLADSTLAVNLLEHVLELDPTMIVAIDTLLPLVGHDLERRESLLRLKIDLQSEPAEKAATLADLAQVLVQRGAPDQAAEVLYKEALTLAPCSIPVLDGFSALLAERGQREPARALLTEAIEQLALQNRRSRELCPLLVRLATIEESLGHDEDAHRYWQDALRFEPADVTLRIAIGMNRFRGGHWRDALRYLQELSGQISAEPRERATEAMFAAGKCEAALRRPDRAAAWYEEALRLDPNHLPSLGELAEAAIHGSQWPRAIELLERQLGLVAPAERPRLLRRLGELCGDKLNDVDRAGRWFEELYALLPEDEATRLEVLPRMLPVLRSAGRHRTAGLIAEELARLEASQDRTRDMLFAAADEFAAAEDHPSAERQLRAVLAFDPRSIEAAGRLVALLEASARFDELCVLLREFLAGLTEPDDVDSRVTMARLFATLARVQQQLGDKFAAIAALERSVALNDKVESREMLDALYGDSTEHAEARLANHRRMLAAAPGRVASLQALAAAAGSDVDRRRALLQVLEALGQLDREGSEFLENLPTHNPEADEPYAGDLYEDDRRAHLTCPEGHGLDEVFSLLWEAAPTLLTRNLGELGVGPGDRISPVADSTLARTYSACARALGIKLTSLYARRDARHTVPQVVAMAPPAIIVGADLDQSRSVVELRFLLGRALELSHPSNILAAGLPRVQFARLLSSVLRAFHPRHMRGRRDLGEEAVEQANQLRKAMPFKIARRLSEIFREKSNVHFDSGLWRQAVMRSANRAGLVLCGDLSVALRLIIEDDLSLASLPLEELLRTSPLVRDLFSFSISDSYLTCRARLGLISRDAAPA